MQIQIRLTDANMRLRKRQLKPADISFQEETQLPKGLTQEVIAVLQNPE